MLKFGQCMLYLMRKIGQSIVINNNIEVKIVEVKGKNVRVGLEFPRDVTVLRKEVHDKVMAENIAAAESDFNFLNTLEDQEDKKTEDETDN